jgi:D-alanyl-D-alanine carboxypeptidase
MDYSNLIEVFQEDCFKDSFHGFVLYDLDSSKYLEYNADKYFTPASNVKIVSFAAEVAHEKRAQRHRQFSCHGSMQILVKHLK